MIISTIVVIVGYCAEIVIKILLLDRSSASLCAGRERRRSRSVAPLCHDFRKQRVTSMNISHQRQQEM